MTDTVHAGAVLSAPVELDIGGMTCASCAARIEKKLNRMPGVTATVNFAVEKASVRLPEGMATADAIATVESAGYTAHLPATVEDDPSDRDTNDVDPAVVSLRHRLLISLALAVPVAVLSMVPPLQFPNWQWLALTMAAPVAVWGAWPFHRAAAINARHGAATMDTLVSVGVLAAFLWSLYALFFGTAGEPGMHMHFTFTTRSSGGDLYLEVASMVTVFLLAGRYAEMRAKHRSGAALRALLELGATSARVLRGDVEVDVAASEVKVGDLIVVRPGEKVATDGRIVTGTSAIDSSLVTGEPVSREVGPGDEVVGSSLNEGGRLIVEATRVGADTELARIGRLVAEAQAGKAQVQRLADRVSSVFVPVVIGLSLITLLVWLAIGSAPDQAFTAAVATLIIACPCALGLATPTALLVGTGRGSQLGILIRGPEVLESTRRLDTVLLDKTGTVTHGAMAVAAVLPVDGVDTDLLLRLAGAAENGSEHPIGRAIARAASTADAQIDRFASTPGLGVLAVVDGHHVRVGRAAWLAEVLDSEVLDAAARDLGQGSEIDGLMRREEALGRTAVVVAWDGRARGVISVADTVKESSAEAVTALRRLGLNAILLTGDNEATARAVATEVGIDEVIAEVRPEHKLEVVRRLQSEGRVVAMVGDGVNDAAALAGADLGIAMGTGTDAAIQAADLTLVRGDLRVAADAVRLARRTLAVIKGNLFWAFAYNVAALPLAMLGLLNPLIAGAAMALSSVFVVTNSLRLRRFQGTAPASTPAR